MRRAIPVRRAMTAIEVLVATVLASLMLGSVLGVLGALARQERLLRAKAAAPAWHRQLTEEITWDLKNSREMVAAATGVRLVGFAGRDFASGRPTGRPAAIEYLLVESAGDRWLVRREEHLDVQANHAWRAELVCRGVERLEFGAALIQEPGASPAGSRLTARADVAPVPERVAVRLFAPGEAVPFFDELLLVR